MRNGIFAPLLTADFYFWQQINEACGGAEPTFSPVLVKAIQMNETGSLSARLAASFISGDGGHGVMQLTSSYPDNWADPVVNIRYAIVEFLRPAEDFWADAGYSGDDLIRCIAAEYNAGRSLAMKGHGKGDVGFYTVNNYSDRALANYHAILVSLGAPPPAAAQGA